MKNAHDASQGLIADGTFVADESSLEMVDRSVDRIDMSFTNPDFDSLENINQ